VVPSLLRTKGAVSDRRDKKRRLPEAHETTRASFTPIAPDSKLGVAFNTLDLDQDGQVLASTDGLMLLRIALGIRGDAVTANAINPLGTRANWVAVRDYLNVTCALTLQ
jgi:hypothetical protein